MRTITCLVVLALAIQAALALTSVQRLRMKISADVPVDAGSLSVDPSQMSADSIGSSSTVPGSDILGSAVLGSASASLEGSAAPIAPVASDSAAITSQSQETIPATQLEGSLSGSAVLPESAVLSTSTSESSAPSDTCNQPAPCTGATIVWGEGSSSGSAISDIPSISVEDALKPIDAWMKDFRSRSDGGGDVFSAAQATVKPLIDKLKHNQDTAIEKLEQSNSAIRQHVEEATTEHIYNLLRAEKIKDEKETEAEEMKEKAQEVKDQLAEKELQAKMISDAAGQAAKAAVKASHEASEAESKEQQEQSSESSEDSSDESS